MEHTVPTLYLTLTMKMTCLTSFLTSNIHNLTFKLLTFKIKFLLLHTVYIVKLDTWNLILSYGYIR